MTTAAALASGIDADWKGDADGELADVVAREEVAAVPPAARLFGFLPRFLGMEG